MNPLISCLRPYGRGANGITITDFRPTFFSACLGLAVALTGLVAILSLLPGTPEEGDSQLVLAIAVVPSAFQNVMHLVLYGALASVWFWTLDHAYRRLLLTASLVIAYGVALELAQLSVPGRFASVLDVALNTSGVALAALILARR